MTLMPDFRMDVTGEYGGNAYPEQREYRVTIMQRSDKETYYLLVEDSGGGEVGEYVFAATVADGIIDMATRDHSLGGFEDDWDLPDGMDRALTWDLPTNDNDVLVRLDQHHIDSIAEWLRFATGIDTYTGDPENWEF